MNTEEMLHRKRTTRTGFEVTFEIKGNIPPLDCDHRINHPRLELGCMRDISRIVLRKAGLQVLRTTDIMMRMGRNIGKHVDVMKTAHP